MAVNRSAHSWQAEVRLKETCSCLRQRSERGKVG